MYKEPNSRRELSVAHSNWTLIFFSPLLVVRMSLMFVKRFEDTKGVIRNVLNRRIEHTMAYRKWNKRTYNDLPNFYHNNLVSTTRF